MVYQLFTYWLPSGVLLGMFGLLAWLVYLMFRSGSTKDDSR